MTKPPSFTTLRFADDLGELSTLIWDPERPRLSILFQQYTGAARGFRTQTDFDAYLAGAFQCCYEEYHSALFDAICDCNIEWIGSQAFIKHGYLTCQEEDWEDADRKFQEDYRLGQAHSWSSETLGELIFSLKNIVGLQTPLRKTLFCKFLIK